MNCSSIENVLTKMNGQHGATFDALGAETMAEKKLTRRVVFVLLTRKWATWETGNVYVLTDKGRHELGEIMAAKKVGP